MSPDIEYLNSKTLGEVKGLSETAKLLIWSYPPIVNALADKIAGQIDAMLLARLSDPPSDPWEG